jgi:formylglycine-generating enzyme required for sulfatase activity
LLESTGYNTLVSTHIAEETYRRHLQNAKSFPEHPVTAITWHEAVAYAASFGKRLPTEREWEKAARGTDGRIFPWGNMFDSKRCNSRESGLDGTTPVKKYENGRSPFGCYDMAGNVFEWTNDWSQRPRFSPLPNSEKVNKGASYNRPAENLVCWFSESDPPSLRMVDVGFRCVYVPDEL